MADHLPRLYERNPATGGLQSAGNRPDDDTLVEAGDIYDTKGPDDPGQDGVVDTLREVRKDGRTSQGERRHTEDGCSRYTVCR